MVGTGGFEPPTSCVSSKRSPPELRAYSTAKAQKHLYVYSYRLLSVKVNPPAIRFALMTNVQ